MLASLALISAIAAYVDFARTGDVRWLMGRDGDPRQLALFLFRRRVPVNFRLCAIPAARAPPSFASSCVTGAC